MTLSRGSITSLLAPGIRKVYGEAVDELTAEYTQYMNVVPSKRQFEDDTKFAGFGITVTKPEGTNTIMDDPVATGTKRYTHTSFGLAFRVTREAADDELYSQINRLPRMLVASNAELIEQTSANVLSLGFTTETSLDGETVFDAAHIKLGGGSFDNLDSASLSITALQAARNYFEIATNERGLTARMQPGLVIIPPNLEFTADEILKTRNRPFTSDNTINSILGKGLENVKVCHFLNTTTEWFVLGNNKERHWPNFFMRQAPTFENGDDFLSGDMLNKTFLRFSIGVTDPQGMFGSTG